MILVHLALGFEEIEALTVVDILRRAGLTSGFVSVTGEKIVTGSHGIKIQADYLFEEVDYENCDMMVLPGGMPGATNLAGHTQLCERLKEFDRSGKAIGAICAGPLVLGRLGILEGRKATIYPGMEEYLGGGEAVDIPVVRDQNIITSRGPATAMAFAIAIVEYFKGKEAGEALRADLLMR